VVKGQDPTLEARVALDRADLADQDPTLEAKVDLDKVDRCPTLEAKDQDRSFLQHPRLLHRLEKWTYWVRRSEA